MTDNEYIKALQPFEKEMNNVIFSKFLRQLEKSKVDELLQIHKEYFDKDFFLQPFCSKCIMDLIHKLGTKYYELIEVEKSKNEIKKEITKKIRKKNEKL